MGPIFSRFRWFSVGHILSVAVVCLCGGGGSVRAQVPLVDSEAAFKDPAGGWAYVYPANPGDDAVGPTNDFDSLDGSWDHENGSDEWSQTNTKVFTDGDILRITDDVSQTSGNDNDRKIYFARNTAAEGAGDDFIDRGATLRFRARGNYIMHDGGKDHIGLRQKGGGGAALISFALNPAGGGHIDVTDGLNKDDATALYSVDVDAFHDYWITIAADNSVSGKSHKVVLWMDGDLTAKAQAFVELPATAESDYTHINYLTMGCGSSGQTGYLEVDYLAYRFGAVEPVGNLPPEVFAGADRTVRWPYRRWVALDPVVVDDDPCGLGRIGIDYGGIQWASDPGTIIFDPCERVANPLAWLPGAGTYELQVRVQDELQQEDTDTFMLTVHESLAGDLDLNYRVDPEDLGLFVRQWQAPPGCAGTPTGCADLTDAADGVDIADFGRLAENWAIIWPTVVLTAGDPAAGEEGSDPAVFVFARSPAGGALTVHYKVEGTATAEDYQETLSGEITIPGGQPSASLTVTPVDDGDGEPPETVQLHLVEAPGYHSGDPNSATATIADNDFTGLQSAELLLMVVVEPYAYRVIEKGRQETLVSQRGTRFTFTSGVRRVLGVTNASVQGDRLEATLELDGAPGTAQAVFSLEESGLLKVVYSCTGDTVLNIEEEFDDQGEHYYGIWEYPQGGHIDNRGADRDLIGFGGMADTNYANARAPFYVTTRRYAVYVDTTALGHYTIAKNGVTRFDFDEEDMTYYVIYGPSYERIFGRFNDLAGPAWMPPDWAFDSIWWRDDDHNDRGHTDLAAKRTIDSAEDNVIATANHLQYYQIPASAIWIDRPYTSGDWGWGNMDFNPSSDWFPSGTPNGQMMIDTLESKGYHLLLWIANRLHNNLYSEALANGYMFPSHTSDRDAADLRNPAAYNWFKGKLDSFVSRGVRGYKIDRGHEGEMPDWAENENVYLNTKMAAEGQRDRHGGDYLIHARNAYDKSRRYVGVWNGDTDSDFGGLAVSIKNGLRCGAINFPYYGSDIGGYISDHPSEELFARWLGFGAYSTMMEILIDPDRTIWYAEDFDPSHDPNLVDIARKHCQDHHDLIPYTRTFMYQAHTTGMPVMRQLIFAYPDDPQLYDRWDEYLYGSEILVAPVVSSGVTGRSVYLPADEWLDYHDKVIHFSGPATVTVPAPLEVIPLFVRAGAIIPRGDILQSNNNWTANWSPYLRLEFFPKEGLTRTLDYYDGTTLRPIICQMASDGGIHIDFDDVGYEGALEIYTRQVGTVTRNGVPLTLGVDYTFDPVGYLLRIPFSRFATVAITGGRSLFAEP